jgi:hypothetical protein
MKLEMQPPRYTIFWQSLARNQTFRYRPFRACRLCAHVGRLGEVVPFSKADSMIGMMLTMLGESF